MLAEASLDSFIHPGKIYLLMNVSIIIVIEYNCLNILKNEDFQIKIIIGE